MKEREPLIRSDVNRMLLVITEILSVAWIAELSLNESKDVRGGFYGRELLE